MKKQSASTDKNSLKIVFIFVICVAFLVGFSLLVKTIFMIRASKFDGTHRFTILIEQKRNATVLLSFDPAIPSLTIFQFGGATLSDFQFGETLGVVPDSQIVVPDDLSLNKNPSTILGSLFGNFGRIHTDLTLYDIARFYFLAKSITLSNKHIVPLTLPMDANDIDKLVSGELLDTTISQENISVQIINASGTAGMANRLARVVTNMGGNVVSVTTGQTLIAHSSIRYFGSASSYSLIKFSRLLGYQGSPLPNETIADILITIGKDSSNTTKF